MNGFLKKMAIVTYLQWESSVQHPTSCGQDFFDIQGHVCYTALHRKQVLINYQLTKSEGREKIIQTDKY